MAMAAILWLVPRMEELVVTYRTHPVVAYVVAMVCMSVAAQLGTFPLVLHHFGTFPSYFLLTNLLAVPCLSVVLALMLVWWMLVLLGIPLATPLGILLQHAMGFINTCLAHVAQWPGAVLHVSSFPLLSVLFTYLLIASLALFVIKKWSRGLIWSLVALIGLSLSLL
jgi:competence protein ComEC